MCVITFDMANLSTLANAKKWLDEVHESNSNTEPLIFLVGNKKELLCESAFRFVEREAIRMANALNAEYWSVSAQTGENIVELFNRIAALTFHDMIWREIDDKTSPMKKYSYSNFIKISRIKKSDKRNKHCISVTCAPN